MRDQKLAILLCLGLGCPLQSTLGFIPSVTNSHLKSLKPFQANDVTKSQTSLNAVWDNQPPSSGKNSPFDNNVSRTCIKHFLTQRSVQSFMFLLEQCRDPHTVDWMEKFSDTRNLLHYHGTGAFNMTRFENWDSFLMEMVACPKETVIVSCRRRGAGTGGWSKNNPYLKPRFVEFHIDIDPPSLSSRILSVREQIAKEWIDDLEFVIRSGDLILDSYFDNVARERDEDQYDGDIDAIEASAKKPQAFERTVSSMMNNLNPYEGAAKSSPFRKGNFDLLHLLATQESIHRVLRNLKQEGSAQEIPFNWLRDFYIDRIPTFFDGNQNYGSYDDFLEELLQSNPSVRSQGGKVAIVDPVGLTEKIIRIRGAVAREWKEKMIRTPEDHIDLRRNLLSRQMQASIAEEPIITRLEEGIGEFE